MKHTISPEILKHHVGILGKTGSGKSNFAKVLEKHGIGQVRATDALFLE